MNVNDNDAPPPPLPWAGFNSEVYTKLRSSFGSSIASVFQVNILMYLTTANKLQQQINNNQIDMLTFFIDNTAAVIIF